MAQLVSKYVVVCPHCGGEFHETTGYYDQETPTKGHMLCDQPYVDDAGYLLVRRQSGVVEKQYGVKPVEVQIEEAMAEYEPEPPGTPHQVTVDHMAKLLTKRAPSRPRK